MSGGSESRRMPFGESAATICPRRSRSLDTKLTKDTKAFDGEACVTLAELIISINLAGSSGLFQVTGSPQSLASLTSAGCGQ